MNLAPILPLVLLACLPVARAGEIAELYRNLPTGEQEVSNSSRGFNESQKAKHGVTEIGLERTHCFGRCPVYSVVIKSDGTFRYHGQDFVERKGDFTGKVNVYELNQLAQFIKDSAYMDLDHRYSAMVTDLPTVFTTVVMDQKRQVISNYADAAPSKVWIIEKMIDHLLSSAKWDPPGSAPATRPATPAK